jgi:hypothetical protein
VGLALSTVAAVFVDANAGPPSLARILEGTVCGWRMDARASTLAVPGWEWLCFCEIMGCLHHINEAKMRMSAANMATRIFRHCLLFKLGCFCV